MQLIASRCSELESGARVVDAILTNTVLPTISQEFLTQMMAGKAISAITIRFKTVNLAISLISQSKHGLGYQKFNNTVQ